MRPFREITRADVGRNFMFEAFGKKWMVSSFIGQILPGDVGKRVYQVGDILQVENDEQRAARLAQCLVVIHYVNGSTSKHPFANYGAAREFCRNGVSYSGDRVRRVEIMEPGGGCIAVWDRSWDDVSKQAGLSHGK